jgi:pantoate kinase
VSAIYDDVGAGAITIAGGPGFAEFLHVKVPRGLKLVTASQSPYRKTDTLSSATMRRRVNNLGAEALRIVTDNPTFDTLLNAGESFARKLGLETSEIRSLIRLAEANGATHASQNMIGYAIHSVAREQDVPRLVAKLGSSKPLPWVQVYDFGTAKAGVIRNYAADYPTVTSSLV